MAQHETPESGLAVLQAILASGVTPRGIGKTLDFHLTGVEPGKVMLTANPSAEHYNPLGSVHGGYAATVLDGAMALALYSTLPARQGYATTALIVHYTRAITDRSGPLTAIGRVVHSGRQGASAAAELFDAEGRLCAHATSSLVIREAAAA